MSLLVRLFFLSLIAGLFLTDCRTAFVFSGTPQKVAVEDSAMVVTAHPLATQVGVSVLRRGGNAVDAAVAVQFALAVVYPQAGNLGGGGFLLLRKANGEVEALDFREKAPMQATRDMFLDEKGNAIAARSRYGLLAAGVPGTVDGMWEAHRRHGKLPWASVVQPAIDLAKQGYAITAQEARNLNDERARFLQYNQVVPVFVRDSMWKTGDVLVQADLAGTLGRLAALGRDGFYRGGTAGLLVRCMEKGGGLISYDDLANYKSVWRKPLEFDFRQLHLISMPPPSSGGVLLQQMLGMVEPYPLEQFGFHTSASVHLMAEAERRAFADRAEYLGDPDFVKVPVEALTRPAYLKRRMSDFSPSRAGKSEALKAGALREKEQTTHFGIVDAKGNAVAVTTTLNDTYGARTVVPGAGFLLNNEMDDFSAKPGAANLYGAVGGSANAVGPGKRPLSSMTPTIVTRGGRLWMVLGTPGGTTIPTSVFQMVVNTAVFGMALPEAVNAGRFHHQWKPDKIQMEAGALPDSTVQRLRALGHTVDTRSPIGRVEAILRLPDGRWQGVADPRGDDAAEGF